MSHPSVIRCVVIPLDVRDGSSDVLAVPPSSKGSSRRVLSAKGDHIDAALDGLSEVKALERPRALGFADLRFLPATLPEVDLSQIDLSLTFLGKTVAAPLMIAPMTGGLSRGGQLNRLMASAAQRAGIPFAVGSQRVALEVPSRSRDFAVRRHAPTIPIFANLGAIQLTKGFDADDAQRAVDMIEADALFLHVNAMQEVIQEGGDTDWRGVLKAIGNLCTQFARRRAVPVFVREVGFGIPTDQARRLLDAGVHGLDCAGGGGTSWTLLEGRVAAHQPHRALGEAFASWGLTTPESIIAVRRASRRVPLIASGGVRSGLDVARSLALGATLGAMAAPVLRAATQGPEALDDLLGTTVAEIRAALFGVGARSLAAFRKTPRLLPVGDLCRL